MEKVARTWLLIQYSTLFEITLLDAWPGLGTQPCHMAPGDLWVELGKTKLLTSGE